MEGTIWVIQEIAKLVPIEMTKVILTDIATILSLFQKHAKGKDGLNESTRHCRDICATLAFSAKGSSMNRMGEPYRNALSAFQLSIDHLQLRVRGSLERKWRWFGARLDVMDISVWNAELEKAFKAFSKNLNIVIVITLEQIYDLLRKPDIPSLFPQPPPLPPVMFFGREALLRAVEAILLRDGHVALIGPGGIGKSTLAMAVLNEELIIEHYRRRFFVSYSGMNPKTVTFASFVDRIASTLGLQISGAECVHQIETNLGLSPVLVVLDNAEAFEDAVDRDEATRISDLIAHIANTRGVTIILTSRTSFNARNVLWTHFVVPPLERVPARLPFRQIYHGEISDEEIDKLLAAVDFHPLSISILAYTARENRWSAKVLSDRWNLQRSECLQSGNGKDNLEFTIRLSLESPSVKALGDDAVRVLRVIAFFPHGINQDHLTRLFPSVPGILSIMDTLCKVSLVCASAAFLTILAPIRLFLETLPTTGLELLEDIRRVYYQSLKAISREKNSHSDLLISDHLNIEHLIAFDIVQPSLDLPTITSACRRFLLGLKWHKPRHTSFHPIISSLPEETTAEKVLKAQCLFSLGCLFYELSNFRSAVAAHLVASTLFIVVGMHNDAAVCTSDAALAYNALGYYSRAQQLLHDFIRPSWRYLDEERKATIYFVRDWSAMHSSSKSIENLFLRSMNDSWHHLKSHICHWRARLCHGCSTPEELQKHLKPIRSDCMTSSDVRDRWEFLEALADSAFLQRKFDVVLQLLNQAQKAVNDNFSLTISTLTYKAAVASHQGDYNLSRSLSKYCIDTLNVVGTSSSTDYLRILYVQGRNELYAGDHPGAQRFLTDAIANCGTCGDIETKTFSLRALGELMVLIGNHTESNGYFSQTMQLCKEGGVPPELLGVCEPMIKLDDEKFPGWKRFLDAPTG